MDTTTIGSKALRDHPLRLAGVGYCFLVMEIRGDLQSNQRWARVQAKPKSSRVMIVFEKMKK
jgi:hypothetical protein